MINNYRPLNGEYNGHPNIQALKKIFFKSGVYIILADMGLHPKPFKPWFLIGDIGLSGCSPVVLIHVIGA